MQLPTQLLRHKKNVHKNTFGHVLILAGSQRMLGAAALSGLSSMRSGAGLVTIGTPKSLNIALQKKISNEIMTLPLPETKERSLSFSAFSEIKKVCDKYSVIAIGPGLSFNKSTKKLVLKIIESSPIPLVIDADAINVLAGNVDLLKKKKGEVVLTPHPGEFAKLIKQKKDFIENNRKTFSRDFANTYKCTLLLKGNKTIVASEGKKIYVNSTGNSGMATAGSGDVLTGMIAAFIGQGMLPHDAAKCGAYFHGKAGDLAAKSKSQVSMIASDIIEYISQVLRGKR